MKQRFRSVEVVKKWLVEKQIMLKAQMRDTILYGLDMRCDKCINIYNSLGFSLYLFLISISLSIPVLYFIFFYIFLFQK
jgi:hypothetical protein